MSLVKTLRDVGRDDVHLVGGKAANLGFLIQNNISVPQGYVVTTEAFQKFVKEYEFEDNISSQLNDLDVNDYDQLRQVSSNIDEYFLNNTFPNELVKDIKKCYERLDLGAVVCRSSSTFEDSTRASFAGQHETFVNIQNTDEIINSVRKCWASLYTPRVLAYAVHQGISIEEAKMAVVVQKIVSPERSGVMFTSHPNKGEDYLLIESNWGLGDSVVSGDVTPDKFTVDKCSLSVTSEEISDKKKIVAIEENGDTEVRKTTSERQRRRSLDNEEIKNLGKLGMEIEELLRNPQDIEWALEDGEIRILQTRSITG